MKRVTAPWTDEQVAAIRAWQADERFHGLTCDVHSNDLLDVDNAGLSCWKCSYTQTWVPGSLVLGAHSRTPPRKDATNG